MNRVGRKRIRVGEETTREEIQGREMRNFLNLLLRGRLLSLGGLGRIVTDDGEDDGKPRDILLTHFSIKLNLYINNIKIFLYQKYMLQACK